MKKIISTLILVCFLLSFETLASASPKWLTTPSPEGIECAVDLNSFRKKGDFVTVEERITKIKTEGNGIKSELFINEYDLKNKKKKNISRIIYNTKGVKVASKKGTGKWLKLKENTVEEQNLKFYADWSRKLGSWEKVKNISDIAIKYFDTSTIKRSKGNVIDVWERLELNKATNNIKNIVSNVQYNIKNHKATTVYTCNFDAAGNLVTSSAEIDKWTATEDSYGEYIGDYLDKYLKNQKKK